MVRTEKCNRNKEHIKVIKINRFKSTLSRIFNFALTNLLTKGSPSPEIFI